MDLNELYKEIEKAEVDLNAKRLKYIKEALVENGGSIKLKFKEFKEFKETRAVDQNIKVKLKGFKKAYELENTPDLPNHVSIEHYYDVAKRALVKKG